MTKPRVVFFLLLCMLIGVRLAYAAEAAVPSDDPAFEKRLTAAGFAPKTHKVVTHRRRQVVFVGQKQARATPRPSA